MQVYDGSKANWLEEEAGTPINVYGKTKLEAEKLIQVSACSIPLAVHDQQE